MSGSPIQFDIHPSAGAPIYRQLIDQVHAMIAGGRLRAGDSLPSIRTVAADAEVNPMTVSKAYSLLEADGVVERVRGLGMRVLAPSGNGSVAERQAALRDQVAPAMHRAGQLGLTEKQVRQVLEQVLKDYHH